MCYFMLGTESTFYLCKTIDPSRLASSSRQAGSGFSGSHLAKGSHITIHLRTFQPEIASGTFHIPGMHFLTVLLPKGP